MINWLSFTFLAVIFNAVNLVSTLRLCEVKGTCVVCDAQQDHYSFFTCAGTKDCFPEEFCTNEGFCCPRPPVPPPAGLNLKGSPVGEYPKKALNKDRCPSNSSWSRKCVNDADCVFREELCVDQKCCPTCRTHRINVLEKQMKRSPEMDGDLLPASNDQHELMLDKFIPQCTDDGLFYSPMQCSRENECFCVTEFGQKIIGNETEAANKINGVDCAKRRLFSRHNASSANEALFSPIGLAANENVDTTESQLCLDPMRQFKRCGSICPMSCATRMSPPCPNNDKCVRGCFCRLPYVILDATQPFTSRCVLPAECPLLQVVASPPNGAPSQQENNDWLEDSGIYSSFGHRHGHSHVNQPEPIDSLGSTTEKFCLDPLKNFQTCGSACPVACGSKNDFTSCQTNCIPGYYLISSVLPYQCPALNIEQEKYLIGHLEHEPPHHPLCGGEANKTWTTCFSEKCAPSCDDQPPFCFPDDCTPGCECSPPHILLKKSHAERKCILITDCPNKTSTSLKLNVPTSTKTTVMPTSKITSASSISSLPPVTTPSRPTFTATTTIGTTLITSQKVPEPSRTTFTVCEDVGKEFLSCASSCPLGCDHLDARSQCSPCVSGCFCKNGLVFKNASDWRRSECVPISSCHMLGVSRDNKENDGVAEESLNFIPSTSTSTIESSIPEAVEKNCDESVASAVLYVGKNNSRLGRILALPEQGGKIRLVGELMIGLPKEEHASLKLLLSLHKFGDTTMNGCRNIGPPLQFVEIPQTSEQQDGKDVEPVTEIQINHYWHDADSDKPILVDVHLFIVDRASPSALNINPLIGHSVVIKTCKNNDEWDVSGVVACSVFGIVPAC